MCRRIEAAIDDTFHNSPVQTKTESERPSRSASSRCLGNVKDFLLSICGAVTFTILLVSANTMAMSVRERVREVGILKTLGFTPGTILGIILGEALADLVRPAASSASARHGDDRRRCARAPVRLPVAPAPSAVRAVAWSACRRGVIGLLSSLVPALNASRISILEALRCTD